MDFIPKPFNFNVYYTAPSPGVLIGALPTSGSPEPSPARGPSSDGIFADPPRMGLSLARGELPASVEVPTRTVGELFLSMPWARLLLARESGGAVSGLAELVDASGMPYVSDWTVHGENSRPFEVVGEFMTTVALARGSIETSPWCSKTCRHRQSGVRRW